LNLEEYKAWLEKNGNIEEQKAYEVAKEVIRYHKSDWSETEADLFPRKIIKDGNNRIEFDLLIRLTFRGKRRTTERLIGIEFKEYDIKKAILQAIVRKQYVDYQYIATRFVELDYMDLLQLSFYSIGWVIWDEDFVKLLVPAKYTEPTVDICHILNEVVKDVVRKKVREELETLTRFIG